MANPLFTDGFYFFSGMYDDSLIGKFYQKISAETYDRAVQTQNNTIGRLRKTADGAVHYQITFGDLKVDKLFNERAGLPVGTLTAVVPNLILPIWNKRKYLFKYGHEFAKVPVDDFYSNMDIFDKFPVVQLGSYRLMKAVFVVETLQNIRIALPFNKNAIVSYDEWGTKDYSKLSQYFSQTPEEPLWIFMDSQSQAYRYINDEIANSYQNDAGDMIVRFAKTGTNTLNRVAPKLNDSDANSWDFLAYLTDNGNLYQSCPCSLYEETDSEISFAVPAAFIRQLKPGGVGVGTGGLYGYFIQRPNRWHMLVYEYSANQKPIFNLEYFENPAGNTNVEIFEFNPATQVKGRRLYSPELVQSYYPNIYDFTKLNKNNASLLIEINEHLHTETNQIMRNSIQPLMDSLGDFYTTFMINGYDVHDGQGVSKIQRYSPTKFYSTSEDYLISEYRGDIRAYMLDKLLQTFEHDPYLNMLYYEHMTKLDPHAVSKSGTPKTFGFNTQLYGEYTGNNPVVMSTRDVIANDENVLEFTEPNSYITFRSNNEQVAAMLYLNGKYIRSTCQRFYAGVNYLFYPVSTIAAVVNEFAEEDLVTLKPLTLDYFPYTHPTRTQSTQETLRVQSDSFKLFQNGEERRIRLRDLFVFNANTKTIMTNWFNNFDVLYEVNQYEIQTKSSKNTILLDQDQDINSVVPVLTGLYSNPSIRPLGKVQLSLRDTLAALTNDGTIFASDVYSLMNKSLNVKYLTFVPIRTQGDTNYTFALSNFKHEYRFAGDRLTIFPGSATGVLEGAMVDPLYSYNENYSPYLLFRNGYLVKHFSLTPRGGTRVYGDFNIVVSEAGIQPTDEFVLVHMPIPFASGDFKLSSGLKYMQPGNVSGKTAETIWPDDYLPYTDGLLLTEDNVDGSTAPLEFTSSLKFSDHGYRLPPMSKSTYIESALYYDADRAQLLPDKNLLNPTVLRYPTDLPFTHPTNLPRMSILSSIMGIAGAGGDVNVNWFDLTFAQEDLHIKSIYYGKNVMSVTGNFSSGLFSGDGEFWETVEFPTACKTWRNIVYQNHAFVALGTHSNVAAYSKNGVTWQETELPALANWYAVTYGGDKYVAIAMDDSIAAYSFDGITWHKTRMPSIRRWSSIAYGRGVFVVVASTSDKAAVSTNGIEWTEVDIPYGNWCSVAFTATGFLAIESNFNFGAYSVDGQSWVTVELPENIDWIDINNGLYHFTITAEAPSGSGSRFGGYTVDGVNWKVTPSSSDYWDPIASGDDTHVKFGFVDGGEIPIIEVANYLNLRIYEGAEKIREIYYADDRVMVLGDFSGGAFSENGTLWTDMNLPEETKYWNAFMYTNGIFLALPMNSKYAAYSLNGSLYYLSEMPKDLNWYALAYGRNRFVTLAIDSQYGAYCSDGTDWSLFTLPLVQRWTSVTYGNGRFIAIALGSTIGAYSADGDNWSTLDLPEGVLWGSVVFTNGKFLLISDDLQVGATSIDGQEWTMIELPENIDWITIDGKDSKFAIVANNETEEASIFGGYSNDGENWEVTTDLVGHWNPIASGTANSITIGFDRKTEGEE